MWKLAASASLALLSLSAHATPIQMQDADVRDFVHWYSQHTGEALAIDPNVTGTLTAYADDVPDDQLPDFFRGVLQANGYQLVPGNPPIVAPRGDFMAQMDVPAVELQSRTFAFNNVRADDVVPIVNAFLQRGSVGTVNATASQVLRASNALLVSGTDKQLEQLAQVIPVIDVPRQQVLIQAILFETTEGDSFDFSFAAGRARSGGGVAGGVNTNQLDSSLSALGGSFGIFDGSVLALALRAVRQDNNARILSTPQILTLSGEQGLISVGQNVPFITGRVTGEAADITSPFQTIERRDIGVRLNVRPIVSANGLIVMDVETTADSLSNSLLASDIITNQRSITTTVQIRSGQALLLGGLVSQERSLSESKIPLLSDIPLVGGLFRSTSTSSQDRKLYVLLRATVLPLVAEAS